MNVNAVPDVKSRVQGRAPPVHLIVKVKAAIYLYRYKRVGSAIRLPIPAVGSQLVTSIYIYIYIYIHMLIKTIIWIVITTRQRRFANTRNVDVNVESWCRSRFQRRMPLKT